jgi:hypothetical protein
MDICTLVIATTTTLLGCFSTGMYCRITHDGSRQFCTPKLSIDCNQSGPHYDCVRPDGTAYSLPWTADNGSIDIGTIQSPTAGRPIVVEPIIIEPHESLVPNITDPVEAK